MTAKEAIEAYISLSKRVFAPRHRFNFAANMLNLVQAKGKCDTNALEEATKEVVV